MCRSQDRHRRPVVYVVRLRCFGGEEVGSAYGPDAEDVLGDGGVVALRVEAAGCVFGLAVAAAPGVRGAILRERCGIGFSVAAGGRAAVV